MSEPQQLFSASLAKDVYATEGEHTFQAGDCILQPPNGRALSATRRP